MIDKIAKAVGDYRTIWTGVLMVAGALVWAGDTRYQTHDKAEQMQVDGEVREIRRQISDLEIQKGYSQDQREIHMLEARIKVKENQIKEILGE